MITDEYLLSVVPPAMARAQAGPADWKAARDELLDAYNEQERNARHYRAAVIAHYVGFLSVAEPAAQLHWHEAALEHAELAHEAEVAGFMPSLLASVGGALLSAGDRDAAQSWYERAAQHLDALPDGDYGLRLREQILARLDELRIK